MAMENNNESALSLPESSFTNENYENHQNEIENDVIMQNINDKNILIDEIMKELDKTDNDNSENNDEELMNTFGDCVDQNSNNIENENTNDDTDDKNNNININNIDNLENIFCLKLEDIKTDFSDVC